MRSLLTIPGLLSPHTCPHARKVIKTSDPQDCFWFSSTLSRMAAPIIPRSCPDVSLDSSRDPSQILPESSQDLLRSGPDELHLELELTLLPRNSTTLWSFCTDLAQTADTSLHAALPPTHSPRTTWKQPPRITSRGKNAVLGMKFPLSNVPCEGTTKVKDLNGNLRVVTYLAGIRPR